MLESTLAICQAIRLSTEVDPSIWRYRARFCNNVRLFAKLTYCFRPELLRCFVVSSVTLKPEGMNSVASAGRRDGEFRSLSRLFGAFCDSCLAISTSFLLTKRPFIMRDIPTKSG